jgi:probable rRNA maturation factor
MAPTKQDQGIVIQIAKDFKRIDVDTTKFRVLVRAVLKRFKVSRATVSIVVVGDARIRKLNKRFLNRNFSTDCLSFDLSDDDADTSVFSDLPISIRNRRSKVQSPRLFELVVNGERAVKEARSRGHSSEAELALYLIHGLLHNLGFDDSEAAEAQRMHRTEDEILHELGFGSVYNKNSK